MGCRYRTKIVNKMNKRTLIIIAIALGVVALGVGAYFAWKNRAVVREMIPGIAEEKIAPIEPRVERLKLMSSREVVGYWMPANATSSDVLYVAQNGNVMKLDKNGIEEVVNEEVFFGIRTLDSVKGGKVAILSTIKSNGINYSVYDVSRNEWSLINGDTVKLSQDGKEIGFLARNTLLTQDADLLFGDAPANPILLSIPTNFDLQWPQKDFLYLTQKPSADYVSDMWKVDIKTKKLSKFLSDRGLMVQWSPLGDRALKFTTTEGRGHKLSVIDDKGVELAALRFVTMPDKCVMTTPTQMYCAIPRDQEALSRMVLPDDYLKRDVYFQDGIYQIDLTTNGIRAIYEDEEPVIDATNLTVLEDRILFINRYDRKLYSLSLQ